MKRFYTATAVIAALALGVVSDVAVAQHDHEHGHAESAGHSHERSEVHGGSVTMSKEFHVETVFLPDQVRLYLYDGEQNPMHVTHWKQGLVTATGEVRFRDRGRGTASLRFVRATPNGYACPMCPAQRSSKPGDCAECGMSLVRQEMPDGTLWSCPMHPDEHGEGPGRCADCGMKLTPQDYLVAAAGFKGLKRGDARITLNLANLPGATERTLQFAEKFPGTTAETHDEHEGHDDGHGEHDHGHDDHDH